MNRTNLIVAILVGLLIIGGIFVSAAITQENKGETKGVIETQQSCGASGCGCNGQCGGQCGIEGCGCGK